MLTRKWILVAAARPNFMKIAPLMRAIAAHNERNDPARPLPDACPPGKETSAEPHRRPGAAGEAIRHRAAGEAIRPGAAHCAIRPVLVHTGQHYDDNMSDAFFRDLAIPAPDIHLNVGSGSHAEQTGRVLIAFEKVLLAEKPDLVIVVGDVNSTMACALAAVKLRIPVAHVEAGLRSGDRSMPEEINRLVTDAVADFLFTPSPDGDENLLREGVPREKIHPVGDIMVDSLFFHLEKAKQNDILHRLSLIGPGGAATKVPYALVTLHRPANVDDPRSLRRILDGLLAVAERIPVLLPMHPRTRKQVEAFGFGDAFLFHDGPELDARDYCAGAQRLRTLNGDGFSGGSARDGDGQNGAAGEREDRAPRLPRRIHAFPPLGYLEFLNLMAHAALVLTDSGGIQEETTVLNVPCVTLRDTTERPITLTEGTNVLVHDDPEKIRAEADRALAGLSPRGSCPAGWDGRTAQRIVAILARP